MSNIEEDMFSPWSRSGTAGSRAVTASG